MAWRPEPRPDLYTEEQMAEANNLTAPYWNAWTTLEDQLVDAFKTARMAVDMHDSFAIHRLQAIKPATPPALAQDDRYRYESYKVGVKTFWRIRGPNGYYRDNYGSETQVAAETAFWNGDWDSASQSRKAHLVDQGLMQEQA